MRLILICKRLSQERLLHTSAHDKAQTNSIFGSTVVHCTYCGRTRRSGDRWGSGTMDSTGRRFCSYDCAWTVLVIDEHCTAIAAHAEMQADMQANEQDTTQATVQISAHVTDPSTAQSAVNAAAHGDTRTSAESAGSPISSAPLIKPPRATKKARTIQLYYSCSLLETRKKGAHELRLACHARNERSARRI